MRGKNSRWIVVLLCSLGLFLTSNLLRADDEDQSTDTKPAASSPASPKSVNDRLKDLEDRLSADEDSNNQKFKQAAEDKLRLHFNLYGDGEYRVYGPSGNFPQQNGFYLGQTDIHIMAQYGAHISAMVEDVVEFDGQNPSIDFERVLASYAFDDRLRIGVGRDHTCFGYWNRTFHHGSQFQTTIDRPFFLAFEDGGGSDQSYKQTGVVPNHIVGVFADGIFDLGGSSLKYEFNIGNNGSVNVVGDGSGNPTSDGGINFNPSGGDNFNSKRLAGRLVFKPDTNGGLAIGVASVLSHYSAAGTPDITNPTLLFNDMAQLLLEGEVIYIDDKLEFLSEFYNFNDAIGLGGQNGSANNFAFYAQLAYQAAADLKPYVRVEDLIVGGSDPFFTDLGYSDKKVYLVGVRYDIAPLVSSLKVEAHFINANGGDFTEFATAMGWGF